MINQCPVCERDYKSGAAKVFADSPRAKFLHFTCHNCGSHFMAMIMLMAKGAGTVGMVTDLNFSDTKKLHAAKAITLDELIEGHRFINSINFKIN